MCMFYLKIKVDSDLNFHKAVMSLVVTNYLLMLLVKEADQINFKLVCKSYNDLLCLKTYT